MTGAVRRVTNPDLIVWPASKTNGMMEGSGLTEMSNAWPSLLSVKFSVKFISVFVSVKLEIPSIFPFFPMGFFHRSPANFGLTKEVQAD